MNDNERSDTPQYTSQSRPLTDEERRLLLEKRIKELRRQKRREQRRAKRPLRITIAVLLAAFLLLFIFSSIYLLATSGEGQTYQVSELTPTNLSDLEGLQMSPNEISVPAISASAAVLVDATTGDVLYEIDADRSLPMASTTKIMTALVALENGSLDESTTVSEHAAAVGESSAWLEAGEVLTLEQLLYALMLQSANDAAVAIAEQVGGSEDAFVAMMNDKAREMGLEQTSFANPHGLDQQGHYTSARDLAEIAVQAMTIPKFREIVATPSYEIAWPGHPFPRVMENHNRFLELYEGAIGIKTGYTAGAGKCLVAASQKNGRELISVILNGGDSYWDQTAALMNYGYEYFTTVEFAYADQPVAQVEVGDFPRRKVDAVGSEDLVFTVRRDRLESYNTASIAYLEWVSYPVVRGQELGYMVVAEGTPNESRETLVSSGFRSTPNFLLRFFSFIGAVFALWWTGIKWIVPGL